MLDRPANPNLRGAPLRAVPRSHLARLVADDAECADRARPDVDRPAPAPAQAEFVCHRMTVKPQSPPVPKSTLSRDKLAIVEATLAAAPLFDAFSCGADAGAAELARFLREDALRLTALRTAITHLVFYGGALAGFVTLAADAVQLKPNERKKLRSGKHRLGFDDNYPVAALKVVRLAVEATHAEAFTGTGTELMRFAHAAAVNTAVQAGAGCRLLTVDAKPAAVGFYERLGFRRSKAGRLNAFHFDVYADPLPAWARQA